MTVQASIDRDVCVGTGMCEATAPDLFEVGDDGVGRVLRSDVPTELVEAAREAADNCPTRALAVS
jgi:ferredoxin